MLQQQRLLMSAAEKFKLSKRWLGELNSNDVGSSGINVGARHHDWVQTHPTCNIASFIRTTIASYLLERMWVCGSFVLLSLL